MEIITSFPDLSSILVGISEKVHRMIERLINPFSDLSDPSSKNRASKNRHLYTFLLLS